MAHKSTFVIFTVVFPWQMRETLIQNIERIKVTSFDSLQQTSAALVEVTKAEEELSHSAQSNAAQILLGMSTFLQGTNVEEDNTEIVEESGRSVLL